MLVEEKKDEIRQQKQEIEDNLSKLESIKAFMSGSAKPVTAARDEGEGMAIEKGTEGENGQGNDRHRKDKTSNISRLANKLKNERGGSNEKETDKGRSDDVDKDKRGDRDRDRG